MKICGFIVIGLVFLVLPRFCFCQVSDNPDQVFLAASQNKKPVLLIFSGSDWCVPCDRLNKKILSDSAFRHFAAERLIIVQADFPQKRKLAPDQVLWNEKLAEEFNPTGIFPYLLLLNPDKTMITVLDYLHYDTAHFIGEINHALTMQRK